MLNDALGQIGASRITAIGDGSTNANHCQVFYPPLRDAFLRMHFWNFALERVELAVDTTAPLFAFTFRFALPGDFLRMKEYAGLNPSTSPHPYTYDPNIRVVPLWKIEGSKLLSNDGRAVIQYIKRVTNPSLWDAMFYQVVATALAAKLARAIPKDAKKAKEMSVEVDTVLLPLALASDGQEGSVEAYISDDLTWGR